MTDADKPTWPEAMAPGTATESLQAMLTALSARHELEYALTFRGMIVHSWQGDPVVVRQVGGPPEGYSTFYPEGCEWLPLETVDDGEFDPRKHWRLKPFLRVNGRVAQRVFPLAPREG